MNRIANIISFVSNPLFVSIPLSYAMILKTTGDGLYATQWTLLSLLFSGLIVLFVLYGVRKGFISDYDVSIKEERINLYLAGILITTVYLLVVFFLNGPQVLIVGLVGLLIGLLIASLILKKSKASGHVAVIISFALLMWLSYGGAYWLLLLSVPLVAWSRIKLKRHEPSETLVGGVIGVSIVLMLYYIVKYIILPYAK